MKTFHCIIVLLVFQHCYSQELDIFQNDSVYRRNNVAVRTMYSVNGSKLQKEMVTHYNGAGQKTKQYWYWNGEKHYHNVELFSYSKEGQLATLVDSFATGKIEITTFYYDDNHHLYKRVTLNKKDTTDVRTYPDRSTTIHSWYTAGKPYRCDTSIFETETAKLDFRGVDNMLIPGNPSYWHYTFKNEFDDKRNLVKVAADVWNPYQPFKRYIYDERGLLIKKQEVILSNKIEKIQMEYRFKYD